VFRRRSHEQAVADTTAIETAADAARKAELAAEQARKGRATPTRREAEAARKAKLGALPTDRKERRKAERAARSSVYAQEREAVKRGDTRNYPMRDRGPARAFVRDYVDGRVRLLEFLMPVVVLAWLTLVFRNTSLYIYASVVMEAVVVIGIGLGITLNIRVKRAVREKFGDAEVRGVGFYAASRAAMPRFLRQPKPTMTFGGKPK
jgi:hypothetical protein